jgi:hypothetical protein
MMKIVCLLGSPRSNSNSAAIAGRLTQTAAGLGATIENVVLNKTFSYLKPGYISEPNPSRVPAGKKPVFIIT